MHVRSKGLQMLGWTIGIIGAVPLLASCGGGSVRSSTAPVTKAELGRRLFFDTSLSSPSGMACASCHSLQKSFTDARHGPTSEGVIHGLFGFRNAPSIQYMAYSPTFSANGGNGGGAVGGQFWDGRAANLQDQVHFPLLNPTEMNNGSVSDVVRRLQSGPNAQAMRQVYGANVFANPDGAFAALADAISTFEKTPSVSPFTSKYDAFLAGKAELTQQELNGLALFNGKGGCASCHTSSPSPDGTPPLFTNFCYVNIGVPKNLENPYYTLPPSLNPLGLSFVDHGLMGTTGRSTDDGLFMTPTLRNVAVTGPYFHNGVYKTLSEVLNFYNSRDTGAFGPPEVSANEDLTELGHLGFTSAEMSEIIAFLQTLTDGYMKLGTR